MKHKYITFWLSTALLLASIAIQAQTNYFRMIGGIPHLPVVANTAAVGSPVTGAMVFSQADAQALVYNGAAWYRLTELPAPIGTDSEPYFRVVNGIPCMAVINSGGGWTPTPGLMYYSEFEGEGIMVADGANYHHITNYHDFGDLNANAMVDADNQNLFAMPVLSAAPTGISEGAFYMNATTEQFEVYNGSAWQTLNTPPQVSNVTISGTLSAGETLSASYTYTDAENDPEGATTFQWYRATSNAGAGATAISGATAQSYTLGSDDRWNYIGVSVTPQAISGPSSGDEVAAYTTTTVPGPQVCPSATLTVTHTAGSVAPVNQTITYQLVETDLGTPLLARQCWLAQNLGASAQASSATDANGAAAGWFWQFNRKQGYKMDGFPRLPMTTWITNIDENSDWTLANDPCRLLMGGAWRLPTSTEWMNADSNGSWSNYSNTFGSVLKLHAAGHVDDTFGNLREEGHFGSYWSSTQYSNNEGYYLFLDSGNAYTNHYVKARGYTVRCLMEN